MHFYMHSHVDKNCILVKSGCYMPSSPGGVSGMGTDPPMWGEPPCEFAGVSSVSRIEGLSRSYMNTPRGGDSRLDPSRARASATSLSCQRMC
jgi:hypothetical protein